MTSVNAKGRRRRPAMEILEDRAVPATFGVPWHDASNLTLSFAPDGTRIAGHTSSLFQALNAQEPTAVWEQQVLQAFQTWAVQANINIGLVADSGDPFGVAGLAQHDPRFGDIRVGAQPMASDALSISVPNDPTLASSLSGDVLVNSNDSVGPGGLDLESVLLHEAGHVFGLPDINDPHSPMNDSYTGIETLTANDIANLQALYGARALDTHEGSSGNDTMGTATQVPFPGSYTGATPLVIYGDISTNKDVDFYSVRPPSNYNGPVTFTLQSAGISLLTTHLTVLDNHGNVLGDAQASSDFGDTVTVHLNNSSPNTTYYLKVQGATQDVFGIGSYGVAVTFDATNTVSPTTLDTVLRGPYQALSPNDINALFVNPDSALVNNIHNGDGAVRVTQLVPSPGYAKNSHYEAVGSLSTTSDITLYRIQSADGQHGQGLVLTATVRSLSPNGTVPIVTILDGDQNPVSAQVLANGSGMYTVQAANLKPGGNDFLKVVSNGAPTGATGNYALDAQFGTVAANLSTFAGGSLAASGSQQSYNLYIGESQLMQLLLSASAPAAPAGTAVQMTILDKNGNVVYSLNATAGQTVSGGAVFLTPGAYTIRFSTSGSTAPTAFSLKGESISDPIGPVLDDPTLDPVYDSDTMPGFFVYPDGSVTMDPFSIDLVAD